MSRSCPQCGAIYVVGNLFCANCGARVVAGGMSDKKLLMILGGLLLASLALGLALTHLLNSARPPLAPAVATNSSSSGTPAASPAPRQVDSSPAEKIAAARAILRGSPDANLDGAISSLKSIPQSAPEYKAAQALLKQAVSRQAEVLKLSAARKAETSRTELSSSYRQLLSDANPHLNFIDTKLTKTKKGYALWATHEYFSQFTLSIGNDAKVIQAWINANRGDLADANIVRVGVMGRGAYASWSYFDLP